MPCATMSGNFGESSEPLDRNGFVNRIEAEAAGKDAAWNNQVTLCDVIWSLQWLVVEMHGAWLALYAMLPHFAV
jgi:hypothetical protein